MKRLLAGIAALAVLLLLGTSALMAQGVTTSSVRAVVRDPEGNPLAGARVTAIHTPSGTSYGGTTSQDGRVVIPGMRIGGPYEVTVAAIGFERQVRGEIYLTLGVATDLAFEMRQVAVGLGEIVVTAERVFSSERTGAATTVGAQAIQQLPTVLGRIEDFTRLTPQARGTSFVGQDNRLNNITVDGSYFNNSFGLGGQPGDRTGVAPISMDAIEQIQVNIAPYDVRQGNFVGAGVNTVTKSGTNEFTGSVYYGWRNDGLVGTKTGDLTYDPGTFKYNKFGARFGGPIIKNKLFFFASYEDDGLTQPGTTWTANTGGEAIEGTKTRVLASDLDALSSYLQDKFDFNPGPYQGYDFKTPARRYLAKIDYNLNERNKISVRYNHLDSDTDVLMSNSSSLGFGNRRTRPDALNFQGSNYKILENIRSIVGEWNSVIGSNKANNLIIGYNYSDESRGYVIDRLFPMVDILKDGSTYTSFGFEPFTPNNELRYKSFQIQNNFTIYGNKHDLTFGVSGERYKSENVFFPGSQSAYVYSSLADFYTDANDYLANPNRTTSPITLRRFQVRWSNQPGLDKPLQPLEVTYVGGYAQDEWRATDNLTLTLGLRLDVPFFGNTGFVNPEVDGFTFKDENGNPAKYSTSKLPDANILFSPRFGFNWNVTGDRSTQIRGGTGIFTGRPAYVWISNQVGNNGVLTGSERLDNTKARPWNPDPDTYKPANVTGAPASSYALAFSDPNFKFPQVWRSNIAVDQKLPWDLIFTGEFIYSKDVNGIYYINANLSDPNSSFAGPDQRSRWTSGNKIISKVDNAVVLKNQNVGYAWDAAASIEKAFSTGLFLKAAYSYSISKNTVDAGSIAFGSWNNNQHAGDPNNPGLAYSSNPQGSRIFASASYKKDFFGFGATTFSMFWSMYDQGRFSYTFSGDLNGDGGTSNDLIYIPKDKSEMNFETYSTGGVTYTAAQQADAWEAYINQDEYLKAHRGEYAERNGVKLPTVNRADFSFAQDLSAMLGGTRNTLEFRLDILNVTNLISKDWGQGQQARQTQPLTARGADSQGRALYRLRTDGTELLKSSFKPTNFISDVYTIQFGFRYMFN